MSQSHELDLRILASAHVFVESDTQPCQGVLNAPRSLWDCKGQVEQVIWRSSAGLFEPGLGFGDSEESGGVVDVCI